MQAELENRISKLIENQKKQRDDYLKKYPDDPPNNQCKNAYIKGLLIENSFEPRISEINKLFETNYENVYVWTYEENKYSVIVIDVNLEVKELSIWKNIGSVIWLALQYNDNFQWNSEDFFEYKWMYYFDNKKKLLEHEFNNVEDIERNDLNQGRILKVTDIGNLASVIELMLRDDKAYTALMALNNSFLQHHICLECELGKNPYHDHLSKEPEIWEHAMLIPNMEVAIVQACRCVEAILGQPPNKKKQNQLMMHKKKWIQLTGINPDDIFEKANITYIDYYYELFYHLRNSSAHSYGNIHYDLENKKTVEAQCFAFVLIKAYFYKNKKNLDEAQKALKFNFELLKRVDKDKTTRITKNE